MATNPMKRKSKISFLLGMLLMSLLLGAVIVILILQLKNYREKEAEEQKNKVSVYVLKQDVKSGALITPDMIEEKSVNRTVIPSNAIDVSILKSYSLTDKEGNEVITEYKNNNPTVYIKKDGNRQEVKTEKETGNFYIEQNGEKKYIELVEDPVIAKVKMNKNSVLTVDMISKIDEKTTNDLRKQEYNIFVLPTQLQTGEYVDVRLALPSGQDYIVVSKKQVEIPQIAGVDSDDTIWLKMNEEEIIIMNNAIVDAYRILGAKLYVTTYTEAGMQDAAIPTYIPKKEVVDLINNDRNIVQTAMNALAERYNDENYERVRNSNIDRKILENGEEGEENLKTKVEESITNSKENRKQYLESLGGDY